MIRSYWELHFDEQRQEGLWIQGVNATVPQRLVFRVYASKLASDESLGRHHMGVVATGELDYFNAHIRLREPDKSKARPSGTSVESSIPCSHGGRALVVKGAEEVENAKTNSK
ncbi:hypothetical protein GW17_00030221 [Ensete ventricosum]|nr:hypothetical protein GW17_00030221 [Ensete ventricosum]